MEHTERVETAPSVEAAPLPRPEDWGVTEVEAAALLARQVCPVCGEGPWLSPLNHVSRKHGIDRNTMRDICGLSTKDKVTDEAVREKWSTNGRAKVDTLRANSEAMKGSTPARKARRTKAAERSLATSGLMEWIEQHPQEMAALRADFRSRMEAPEAQARWRSSMERAWAARGVEMTPEGREEFRKRMSSPDVVEKRRAVRESKRAVGCAVEGCPRAHVAKGLCKLHWRRVSRDGKAGTVEPMSPTAAAKKPRPSARSLTEEQIEEARALCGSGMSQSRVAEMLGVSQSIVSRAVRGEYRPTD